MDLDMDKVGAFAQQVAGQITGAVSTAMMVVGDRLGLYRALARAGALTPAELAQRCSIAERYAREWLANQAASRYLDYDPESGRFALPEEHAAVLADEDSPYSMAGGFVSNAAVFQVLDRLEEAFRTGEGVGYHAHDPRLFHGIERFFRPAYVGHRGWIGLRVDLDPDWDEVAAVVVEAYRCVAPETLVRRLGEPEPA